ncbi:MAG: twin-arginine translocation signal domain-containing protein, partial [Planctomycetes bacterium]|nr:twin-arginine translocation signal domain-containing protein [Planctomycetota bacterium]
MNDQINRRNFLRTTGALGAAATMTSLGTSPLSAAEAAKTSSPHAEKIGWRLACQLYTFRAV